MLLGRPDRAEMSRSGSASPDERNADSNCAECTTAFTRYGSRSGTLPFAWGIGGIITSDFASRNRRFAMRNDAALLRLEDVRKYYGAVRALAGVYGAGKSTLIKVMTGAIAPDSGAIHVAGRTLAAIDPHAAHLAGIAAVYQQPALFPHLSVAENIALGRAGGDRWRVDWRARRETARRLLARAGSSIDPDRPVETLSMPEQQIVEIARALGSAARVFIMDEPTASLGDQEVASLLDAVRRLKADGAGIVYISHRLDEIATLADRVTVLRDGESVGTFEAAAINRDELVRLMVGRPMTDVYPPRQAARAGTVLELDGVGHAPSGVRDVSLSVREGEIVG